MYLEPFYTKKEKKRISCLMWGICAFLLVASLGYTLLNWLSLQVSYRLASDQYLMEIIGDMAQYLLAVPVSLLIMRKVPADPMEKHSISLDEWFRLFCIAYLFMVVGAFFSDWIIDLLASLRGTTPSNPLGDTSYTIPGLLLDLVSSVILAPIAEELIFRKFLLDRVNRLGDLPAVLLSGLVFGLMHGNFYQFFYAAMAGMLFAWIYLRTGRILYTILIHMAINFTTGMIPMAVSCIPAGEVHEIFYAGCVIMEIVLAAAGLIAWILMLVNRQPRFLKGWLNVRRSQIVGTVILNSGMIVFLILSFFMFWYYTLCT